MVMMPPRIGRNGVTRLRRPPAYDALIRLPLLGWAAVLAAASAAELERYARAADPSLPGGVYAVEIAMRAATVAYLTILAATVVMRKPPVGKLRGMEPRVSALLGTFLMPAVVLL